MPTTIGLIGAGGVAAAYHLPVISQMPDVEIRWIVDMDIARARSVANLYSIPEVGTSVDDRSDVDMVLLATPVGSRRELMSHICKRRWHAFCEKPFAATLQDHRTMVAEARIAGIRLGVGLIRRHYAATGAARRLLDHRVLGPVQRVIAGEGAWLRRTGRGSDWYQGDATASGGGLFFETGSHLVDQAFTICRVKDYEINRCLQKSANGLEFETSVNGTIGVEGGERVPFSFVVTRLADVYNGITVVCANGELRVPVSPDGLVKIASVDGVPLEDVGGEALVSATAVYSSVEAEWREFIAGCQAPADMTDWDTGLLTTAFIEESYRAGAMVDYAGAEAAS